MFVLLSHLQKPIQKRHFMSLHIKTLTSFFYKHRLKIYVRFPTDLCPSPSSAAGAHSFIPILLRPKDLRQISDRFTSLSPQSVIVRASPLQKKEFGAGQHDIVNGASNLP